MCGDVGCKEAKRQPGFGEMMSMGIANSMCGSCDLYGWHQMLGVWQIEEGWCSVNVRQGTLDAHEPKCDYFVKRSDV